MTRWDLASSLRLRRPFVILLISIGLTAVAVVDAQRAVRSQQAVAERALRDYASFAVWSFGQHLTESIAYQAREVLGAVNHGDNLHTSPRVPRARDLAHYLPYDSACGCHRTKNGPLPDTFFALEVGQPGLDVALNSHVDATEGWEVDRPLPEPLPSGTPGDYSADDRNWVVDSLTRRIRGANGPDHGYNLVVGDTDGPARVVSYTLMPTSRGDTMVYGVRYSAPALVKLLANVLDGPGLLPATFTAGHRNRDVVAVRVRDASGRVIFDSSPGMQSPIGAHLEMGDRQGRLSIAATIRPELAGTLVIGGLPASHLPFLLGLLALAATMSVVAVMQLRREGELARLRSGFVSSVSHELRTPLAQIRLYTDTLRLGRAETPEQRDWSLGHIDRETRRLGHLVENTLRFSRLGSDESGPADPIEVGPEVQRIVAEFGPLAESRRATIETAVETRESAALRPDALRHMLINLLDNAVKYGPEGQVIRVGVAVVNDELRLSVADEGPGVGRDEADQVWKPFQRGGAARGLGGSGIGLTIVREVAELHGGRAWVEPAPGRGARFVVALPMAPRPAVEG